MDNKIIQSAILGAATIVMSVGIVVKEKYKLKEYIPKEPHLNQDLEREKFMDSILNRGVIHCTNQIRMRPSAFYKFCDTLFENGLIRETAHMSIREQVMIFLHIIGHNVRFRVIGGRFHRSIETVHRYFKFVLNAILRLYKYVIKLPDDSTPSKIKNSQRFYPYFKDCVGAIDGTHVRAKVPINMQGKCRGRKEGTTQNVLAAITFDLKFTFVLAGWEGSAHDSRILTSALARPNGFKVPEGKFYLGDAGYGIRNGIISPYRGVRYHLKEFTDNPPLDEKELFNLRHSSLRTTIERGFGILKKRFRVLDAEPHWSFQTQVDVVLACCIIHNFIIGADPLDMITMTTNAELESQNQTARSQQTQRQERDENREWAAKRDVIAHNMWEDYLMTQLQ